MINVDNDFMGGRWQRLSKSAVTQFIDAYIMYYLANRSYD